MIVCVMLGFWVLGLILFRDRMSESTLKAAIISLAMTVFIFAYVSHVNSRTYQTERFNVSIPRSDCTVRENKNETIVLYQNNEYIVPTSNVVTYDAVDKKSEQVELQGERRIYNSDANEFLYKLYYMRKPVKETCIVTTSINLSKFNPSNSTTSE